METWTAAGKNVTLFTAARDNAPLVLLHTFEDEGESVYRAVQAMTDADYSIAAIGGLRWEDEMSPWENPPVFNHTLALNSNVDAYASSGLY